MLPSTDDMPNAHIMQEPPSGKDALYVPAAHGVQAVAALAVEELPPGQLVHAAGPAVFL